MKSNVCKIDKGIKDLEVQRGDEDNGDGVRGDIAL